MRFVVCIALLLVSGCTLVNESFEPLVDQQKITVYDVSTDKETFGSEWIVCEEHVVDISRFDKIDSIVFEAGVRSQNLDPYCEVQLWNYDKERPVIGSTLRSMYHFQIHTVRTPDFARSFPQAEVRLGMRFRSSADNNYVRLKTGRIIVYHR
jgi:hypothetical protein